jgi:hypothetical protein
VATLTWVPDRLTEDLARGDRDDESNNESTENIRHLVPEILRSLTGLVLNQHTTATAA